MTDCNTKTATKYVVYVDATERSNGGIYHITHDINEARTIAQEQAMESPGQEFHVAAHMTTFRAETVVKEV